jgi:hypothetical protein
MTDLTVSGQAELQRLKESFKRQRTTIKREQKNKVISGETIDLTLD